jgi:hypothetical protein
VHNSHDLVLASYRCKDADIAAILKEHHQHEGRWRTT